MSMRGNEGALPAQPEDDRGRGGLPWGKIIAAAIGLLLLALIIPLACQALTGGSDEGSGGGGQETTGAGQQSDQGAGAGNTSGANTTGDTSAAGGTTATGGAPDAGQQASGSGGTTPTGASGGAGGEQASGSPAGAATAGFGAATGGAVGQVGGQGGLLDQTGDGTTVIIPQATISGVDGWVTVHRDDGGQPGTVIGVAALQEGTNADLVVPLEAPLDSSQRLYAMIHADAPADGTYTFPEGDPPVEADGEPVVEAFRYTAGALAAGEPVPDTGGPALLPLIGGLVLIGGLLLGRYVRRVGHQE